MTKRMKKPKPVDPRYEKEVGPRMPRNIMLRPLDLPKMRNIKRP